LRNVIPLLHLIVEVILRNAGSKDEIHSYTANSDIKELCYIDSCAYGVLTSPVLRVKCFNLQQVGYGGFPYDRHLLVETCRGIAECILCPYLSVSCW